jgi:O-acetyl-ADP-ribose deacetylase (regulator of RNase III)
VTRSRMALSFGERLDLDLMVGEDPPPLTGAMVVPQDIHLILGETGPIEDTRETPEQVLAASGPHRPRRPGSVVVGASREGAPLILQAIVYDFDRSPPAREIHVFEALIAAFEEARTRGIRSVAVQPLGTSHAGLDPERFLKLLAQVCYSSAELETTVRRVHLLLPSPLELGRYEALLQSLADKRGRVDRKP